jgi:hypothetical protein
MMDANEWVDSIQKDVDMLRLISGMLQDFIYSLPYLGDDKYGCCCSDGCDDETPGEELAERAEVVMLRLGLLKQVLPNLTSALNDFESLMTGPVPTTGDDSGE